MVYPPIVWSRFVFLGLGSCHHRHRRWRQRIPKSMAEWRKQWCHRTKEVPWGAATVLKRAAVAVNGLSGIVFLFLNVYGESRKLLSEDLRCQGWRWRLFRTEPPQIWPKVASSCGTSKISGDLWPLWPLWPYLFYFCGHLARPRLSLAALQHCLAAPLPRATLDALDRAQLRLPEDVLDGHARISHWSHQEPLEAGR